MHLESNLGILLLDKDFVLSFTSLDDLAHDSLKIVAKSQEAFDHGCLPRYCSSRGRGQIGEVAVVCKVCQVSDTLDEPGNCIVQ